MIRSDPISPTTAIGAVIGTIGGLSSEHLVTIGGQLLIFTGIWLDWRMRRRWKAEDEAADRDRRREFGRRLSALEVERLPRKD